MTQTAQSCVPWIQNSLKMLCEFHCMSSFNSFDYRGYCIKITPLFQSYILIFWKNFYVSNSCPIWRRCCHATRRVLWRHNVQLRVIFVVSDSWMVEYSSHTW